jgi:hypothetical protein
VKGAKLTPFDDGTREDHFYLRADDDCFYFIEYTARKRYDHSPANSFIGNLKKSPNKRGTYEWRHKLNAIAEAASTLQRELPKKWLAGSTFVPIPPSDAKDDPEYDDRMTQILARLKVDVREVVYQRCSMPPTHESEERHSVDDLLENYEIDEGQAKPAPKHIVIVDDMVTAGAHFRAMTRILSRRFPGVPISGVFLARRIFADDDSDDDDE